ncbi:MAG TPA: hypothetical protein ENF23_02240, partial [Methanosarcinales archaeon]|nr:hypothetical protein [Methanosarcinales archaeon]
MSGSKIWYRMIGIGRSGYLVSCISVISLLPFCGYALAADYGTINVTTANDAAWSTNLSNNVSNVAGDIIVNDGAVLSIENATINMDSDSTKRLVTVRNGGVMNINGSEISHKDTVASDYYGWVYESGSRGNVTNSTIECCVHNNGFNIETNESVSVYNCTFRHGDGQNYVYITTATHGIYLHSASNTSIRDCTIEAGHTKSHNYNYRVRYWYGIHIHDSNDNTIRNITIAEKSSYYHGIYIQNSNNNTLNNISITRGLYSATNNAVHIDSSFNNTLRDFTIAGSKNQYGIHADSSNNTSIINSTINDVGDHGIYIRNSRFCNLTENRITDGGDDGIFMQNSDNATILANNLNRNRDGIRLDSSANNTLTSNTVADSSEHGINITSSGNCTLRSNSITNCTEYYHLYVTGDYDQDIDTSNTVNGGRVYYNYTDSGTITDTDIGHVTIVDCSDLWFTSCTIHNGDGVRIIASSNVSIVGGEIENNTMYGINFESASLNNITSVAIKNNTKQGIYFAGSSNNTINSSDILDNTGRGIETLGSSKSNRIINNNIINNSIGIYLDGNGENNLTDNNVSANRGNGIQLGDNTGNHLSTHNILHNNIVQSNNNTGIVFNTNYNRLTANNLSDNGNFAFALYCEMDNCFYYNYIWRNNTANGEQINYYYDEHDKITELNDNIIENKYLSACDVSNVGKITLIDCTNITIRDSELSNNSLSNGYGIFLWNSDGNNLTNNTISNNYDGIRLYNSSDNDITDLDTISPSDQHGARIESNSDRNNITDSSFAATNSHGLWISSSEHTTLINTEISSVDQYGLSTSGAHYTNLTNATITSSSSDGVRLSSSHYVTIRDDSNITASDIGVYCEKSNHTEINTTITAGTDGIYMSESHWGNLTNNTI